VVGSDHDHIVRELHFCRSLPCSVLVYPHAWHIGQHPPLPIPIAIPRQMLQATINERHQLLHRHMQWVISCYFRHLLT
jgi:hypothetical protein